MSNTKEVDLVREFTLRLAPKLPPKEPQDINDDVWALCGHPTSIGGTCRNAIRRKVRLEQVKLCHIHAKPSIRMQYFFFELSLEVSYNILGHLDPVSRVALALCNKDSLAIVQGGSPYIHREEPSVELVDEIDFSPTYSTRNLPARLRNWYNYPASSIPLGLAYSNDDFIPFYYHGFVPQLLFFTIQYFPFLFNFASRNAWSCLCCGRVIRDRQFQYKNFTIIPWPVSFAHALRHHQLLARIAVFGLGPVQVSNAHRFIREILCCQHWPRCLDEVHPNTFWERVREGARPAHGLEIARLYWNTQSLQGPSE